mgnify:FL=1
MWTPDQQITPDEDKPTKDCLSCKGTGKVIVWDDDEGEQTPEYENCEYCGGEGTIQVEDWEDEW